MLLVARSHRGKRQYASLHVEASSADFLVLNNQVLSGEELSKSAFDFKIDRHASVSCMYI